MMTVSLFAGLKSVLNETNIIFCDYTIVISHRSRLAQRAKVVLLFVESVESYHSFNICI